MNKKTDTSAEKLIEDNLRRAFDEKATEDVPQELLSLLKALQEQDEQNG